MIEVTISIFSSPNSPYANVYGDLELPNAPNIGDLISLPSFSKAPLPEGYDGFPLVVEARMFRTTQDGTPVLSAQLSPIVVQGETLAKAVGKYLETGLGFTVLT